MPITTDEGEGFLPLFPEETEEEIRARWEAWANEGLTPADEERWVDVREGSFWFIATAGGIRESARIYDLMGTEYPAAAIPFWTWGPYLDDVAFTFQLLRLEATKAEGTVTFAGDDGTVIPAGTGVAAEAATPEDDAREYQTTEEVTIASGTADAAVEALLAGTAGDAPAAAVDSLLPGAPDGVDSVTNADPIIGGTDPETDENLRDRLFLQFSPRGGGTTKDYERWGLAYPGVGRVTVRPLWDGPGTVQVILLTDEGDPVSAGTVSGLQEQLDPDPGLGHGLAPVGHVVTVTTAAAFNIDWSVTVELESGYTLDGAGGTVNVTPDIEAAVSAYINGVAPAGEVVITQGQARVVETPGVHDAKLMKFNGSAANVQLDDIPMQVGVAGTATITEGAVP